MADIKRILCPTDFSEASLSAIPYAVGIARLFKAEIFVIHVVPLVPSPSDGPGYGPKLDYLNYQRVDAEKLLDQLINEQIPLEVKASKLLVDGDPADEILQAVKSLQIDLITIATHGHTGWRHLVFGSVAEKVIRMSRVPVLTVRGEAVAEEQTEWAGGDTNRCRLNSCSKVEVIGWSRSTSTSNCNRIWIEFVIGLGWILCLREQRNGKPWEHLFQGQLKARNIVDLSPRQA